MLTDISRLEGTQNTVTCINNTLQAMIGCCSVWLTYTHTKLCKSLLSDYLVSLSQQYVHHLLFGLQFQFTQVYNPLTVIGHELLCFIKLLFIIVYEDMSQIRGRWPRKFWKINAPYKYADIHHYHVILGVKKFSGRMN